MPDMILTCPQCATRYQVDGAKFPGAGRNVRCAKCGHVWHQLGPCREPDPDAEIDGRKSRRLRPRRSTESPRDTARCRPSRRPRLR